MATKAEWVVHNWQLSSGRLSDPDRAQGELAAYQNALLNGVAANLKFHRQDGA